MRDLLHRPDGLGWELGVLETTDRCSQQLTGVGVDPLLRRSRDKIAGHFLASHRNYSRVNLPRCCRSHLFSPVP